MRSVKYSLALASVGALVAFASCTLITDVDRSKIANSDASVAEGGKSGTGGKAGIGGSTEVGAAGDSSSLAGTPGESSDAGNAGATP